MFYDIYSSLAESIGPVVIYPEFEEREAWIDEHEYDPTNTNWCNLDVSYIKRRDEAILKYYPIYTVDNVYELYVFRSLIVNLNKLGNLTGKREFTMGHHIPFRRGGEHFPSNWTIQTKRHNNNAGDDMPTNRQKPTWDEQYAYIMDNLPEQLNQEYAQRCLKLLRIVESFY